MIICQYQYLHLPGRQGAPLPRVLLSDQQQATPPFGPSRPQGRCDAKTSILPCITTHNVPLPRSPRRPPLRFRPSLISAVHSSHTALETLGFLGNGLPSSGCRRPRRLSCPSVVSSRKVTSRQILCGPRRSRYDLLDDCLLDALSYDLSATLRNGTAYSHPQP